MDQQDEQEKQNAADEALDQEVRIVDVFLLLPALSPFCFNFHFLFSNLKVGTSKLSLPVQTPSFENLGLKLSKMSFWK